MINDEILYINQDIAAAIFAIAITSIVAAYVIGYIRGTLYQQKRSEETLKVFAAMFVEIINIHKSK